MATTRIHSEDDPLRGPRPLIARYETLFPSCLDCGDLADGRDLRCSKCASDREHERRLADRRGR
jgi:hypothetical protein